MYPVNKLKQIKLYKDKMNESQHPRKLSVLERANTLEKLQILRPYKSVGEKSQASPNIEDFQKKEVGSKSLRKIIQNQLERKVFNGKKGAVKEPDNMSEDSEEELPSPTTDNDEVLFLPPTGAQEVLASVCSFGLILSRAVNLHLIGSESNQSIQISVTQSL